MKIKPEHVEHLKTAILGYYSKIASMEWWVEVYEKGKFPRADRVVDLQKRFCFDMLYGVPGLNAWVCQNIMPYADDSHLFTALKSFLPKVERKY